MPKTHPSPAQVSNQFADVKSILDKALATSGGIYTAASPGQAVYFRHRCYTFRKQFRESIHPAASQYDTVLIEKLPKDSCEVVFKMREAPGEFTGNQPPAFKPPEVPSQPIIEDDDLLELAKGIAIL